MDNSPDRSIICCWQLANIAQYLSHFNGGTSFSILTQRWNLNRVFIPMWHLPQRYSGEVWTEKPRNTKTQHIAGLFAMGRNNWPKKTSFAIFNIFKTKKTGDHEDTWDDSLKAYKVFPSDQDGVRWAVAEPGIDKRASAYIDSITNRWNHVDIED
ncbi:hypothetical protein E3N88_42840 [Mikania micrantha]|uniref:Uncharacterized protein n=1 Tax=Mikania micrantha TaxID=192012 RepID=A0A5N6LGL1_9ASTR|nr:hypothetical protein E3N88_42840 [Mikania micrantha]